MINIYIMILMEIVLGPYHRIHLRHSVEHIRIRAVKRSFGEIPSPVSFSQVH